MPSAGDVYETKMGAKRPFFLLRKVMKVSELRRRIADKDEIKFFEELVLDGLAGYNKKRFIKYIDGSQSYDFEFVKSNIRRFKNMGYKFNTQTDEQGTIMIDMIWGKK